MHMLFVATALLLTAEAQAYVFLSGPAEAKLDASPDRPVVQFSVSGEVPSISGKSSFLGGKYADLDDEAFWHALINEAIAPWNNISTAYITLEINPDAEAKVDGKDMVHSIVVDSVNLTSAAFASPKIKDDTIEDCDITVGKKRTKAESLAYVMMHEIGHCLGLGHNHSNYDSVMGYSRDNDKLRLAIDDRAGITYLYPNPDLAKPRETLGCAVIDHTSSSKSANALWLCLMAPLAFAAFSFSRRKSTVQY